MANKSAKQLAAANSTRLNQSHLITAGLHIVFLLLRIFLFPTSIKKYIILSAIPLVFLFYLTKLGRPKYKVNQYGTKELASPGEDMAQQGLMEYCWDVVYVHWITMVVVMVVGEWGWWVQIIVPLYGAFLAFGLFKDLRQGKIPGMPSMPGMAGAGGEGAPVAGGQSKRQQKGQKVRYR